MSHGYSLQACFEVHEQMLGLQQRPQWSLNALSDATALFPQEIAIFGLLRQTLLYKLGMVCVVGEVLFLQVPWLLYEVRNV